MEGDVILSMVLTEVFYDVAIKTVSPELSGDGTTVKWADTKKFGVRANADNPRDADEGIAPKNWHETLLRMRESLRLKNDTFWGFSILVVWREEKARSTIPESRLPLKAPVSNGLS